MTKGELLRDINSLPLEAQRQVEDLVSRLRESYANSPLNTRTAFDIDAEAFVGMWSDRDDMRDSSAWIRNIREI